jgi:hypothetical protein
MDTFDSCGGLYSDYSVNVSRSIDKDQVWLRIFAAISFCAVPYAVAMGSSWLDGSGWFKMVQVSSIDSRCQFRWASQCNRSTPPFLGL